MTRARNNRPFVLAAIMVAMFIIAIEATIVSTAMPQIASQLGDLRLYAWVFSAFLLAQTATTVVFGKLADMFGRKPILLVGIAIFLVGSLLCGLATSMAMLIAFRLLQGFGAGAIQPIVLTIVGDLYPAQERGRVQGYLSSVWGVSSLIGPLAGGLITEHLGWAWVFWINVPVNLLAAGLFLFFLEERVATADRPVDVLGAVLFTIAVAGVMAALTEIGVSDTNVVIGLAAFAVAMLLFVLQERRAAEPMIALRLWARRPIASANATTLLSGMALIGLTAFLPMCVQAVLDRSALVAGFTLTAMPFGWPLGALVAARYLFPTLGLRGTLLLGGVLLPLGASPIAFLLGPGVSPWVAGIGSFVMGLGMGLSSTAAIVLIQVSVGWTERGAATAANIFARNLGSTLGATVLGGVLNASLARNPGGPIGFDQIRPLLEHADHLADLTIRAALAHGLHLTFLAMFVLTVLALVAAAFVPAVGMHPAEPGPRPTESV